MKEWYILLLTIILLLCQLKNILPMYGHTAVNHSISDTFCKRIGTIRQTKGTVSDTKKQQMLFSFVHKVNLQQIEFTLLSISLHKLSSDYRQSENT